MKKVFALLLTLTIVFLNTYQLVKADDVIIGGNSYVNNVLTKSDYDKLTYSGLLMEYLRQGGSVDLTNVNPEYGIDDVISEIGDVFVDILKDTGKTIDWLGNQIFYSEGTAYPENLKPRVTTDLTQLGKDIFDQLASLSFNSEEIIEPTPDIDYMSYINTINGHDIGQFFWYNMNGSLGDGIGRPNEYTNIGFFGDKPLKYSWCWINGGSNNIVVSNGYNTGYYVYPLNIQDVNIVSNNGTYSFTVNAPIITGLFGSATYGDTGNRRNGGTFEYRSSSTYWLGGHSDANQTTFTLTVTNQSLQTCFNYLTQYMRNINIYVDGVPWSIVNTNNNYVIKLDTGTIVPTTNGRVEWKYDDEIYIDIDLMWQILDDFLNDSNQRLIRFSDIEDCIVDVDGNKAIAVQVLKEPEKAIDDIYVLNYGTLIPAFPVFINYPVDLRDVANISTVGVVDVIPDDIIEIIGIGILGMLFVTLMHRLLE